MKYSIDKNRNQINKSDLGILTFDEAKEILLEKLDWELFDIEKKIEEIKNLKEGDL